MQKATIEALKELARVALMAAIPLLIQGLQHSEINWQAVGVASVIAVLRTVDKYLHELGKEVENNKLSKGLTRF